MNHIRKAMKQAALDCNFPAVRYEKVLDRTHGWGHARWIYQIEREGYSWQKKKFTDKREVMYINVDNTSKSRGIAEKIKAKLIDNGYDSDCDEYTVWVNV